MRNSFSIIVLTFACSVGSAQAWKLLPQSSYCPTTIQTVGRPLTFAEGGSGIAGSQCWTEAARAGASAFRVVVESNPSFNTYICQAKIPNCRGSSSSSTKPAPFGNRAPSGSSYEEDNESARREGGGHTPYRPASPGVSRAPAEKSSIKFYGKNGLNIKVDTHEIGWKILSAYGNVERLKVGSIVRARYRPQALTLSMGNSEHYLTHKPETFIGKITSIAKGADPLVTVTWFWRNAAPVKIVDSIQPMFLTPEVDCAVNLYDSTVCRNRTYVYLIPQDRSEDTLMTGAVYKAGQRDWVLLRKVVKVKFVFEDGMAIVDLPRPDDRPERCSNDPNPHCGRRLVDIDWAEVPDFSGGYPRTP